MTDDDLAAVIDGIAPVIQQAITAALAGLVTRVAALEGMPPRVQALEARSALPGPPGAPGAPGQDGRDGVDGLGFDDLDVTFDGDRTLALTFTRGGQTKAFPITLPMLRYQGVYREGTRYALGDVVTWAGSTWHCAEPTTHKPGEGLKAWTLIVKRGRDGKDGAMGPAGAKGEPGQDWEQVYDARRAR
jgi:hypothetical protein